MHAIAKHVHAVESLSSQHFERDLCALGIAHATTLRVPRYRACRFFTISIKRALIASAAFAGFRLNAKASLNE